MVMGIRIMELLLAFGAGCGLPPGGWLDAPPSEGRVLVPPTLLLAKGGEVDGTNVDVNDMAAVTFTDADGAGDLLPETTEDLTAADAVGGTEDNLADGVFTGTEFDAVATAVVEMEMDGSVADVAGAGLDGALGDAG